MRLGMFMCWCQSQSVNACRGTAGFVLGVLFTLPSSTDGLRA